MSAAILTFLACLALGCGFGPIVVVPVEPTLPNEIPPGSTAVAEGTAAGQEVTPTATPTVTATPTPTPGPPTPTRYFLQFFSTCPSGAATDRYGNCCPYSYTEDSVTGYCMPTVSYGENEPPPTPRNGLLIALVLPALCLGLPWMLLELNVVRYVRPKGLDLSTVRIKAQDGLFIDATLSITARRLTTPASFKMTWSGVGEFVEKPLEQELLHRALEYPTLEELERNLRVITQEFENLPIIRELRTDFGVEVMRFNIETRYHQETMDALNRRAEATAGGNAYLAFAQAAHLDPDSPESRELYRVYQETTGRVDAARNLGGGLTTIAEVFVARSEREASESDDDDS
ncbi:MAG: hypothetical protein OES12_02615 [Anaerolineae bacterium]|nr:hypothetical protein [Anaerolineae bacterium]